LSWQSAHVRSVRSECLSKTLGTANAVCYPQTNDDSDLVSTQRVSECVRVETTATLEANTTTSYPVEAAGTRAAQLSVDEFTGKKCCIALAEPLIAKAFPD